MQVLDSSSVDRHLDMLFIMLFSSIVYVLRFVSETLLRTLVLVIFPFLNHNLF